MLRRTLLSRICRLSLAVILAADCCSAEETSSFFNVVAPAGADPWVLRHNDGWYYATVTTGVNVVLVRSTTISGLAGGERKVVWSAQRGGKEIWAPAIYHIRGDWYIYVAADDGENAKHRLFVLQNKATGPFQGQFTLKSKIFDPKNDRWKIDGTVAEVRKRLYFIWSGWEGNKNVRQNLYIAPMKSPWALSGPRVLISSPTLGREHRGGPPSVNEGPQVLINDDLVHIVYSAAASWTDDYCLGLLTAKADSNLLSPGSWKKHEVPVFASGNNVYGPGHCCFVKSPDEKEDWIIYHSARFKGAGWTRLLRAQPIGWNENGTPDFGAPAPPNLPIALPGGEPRRLRLEAEAAMLRGSARAVRVAGASGGAKVGYIDTPESSIIFEVPAEEAGDYLIVLRFGNGSPNKSAATHRLAVNDATEKNVRYENSGWDQWSNAFVTVPLKSGVNRVSLGKGDQFAELDCLDVLQNR